MCAAKIEDSIPDAIKSYEKVVELENGEKGEWYDNNRFLCELCELFVLMLLSLGVSRP